MTVLPSIVILLKAGPVEADDHAGDAFVADQHVRAAAQQAHLQPFVAAALDHRVQLVDGSAARQSTGPARPA